MEKNIINDELSLQDSIRGNLTIVDEKTGEIVFQKHNMIVNQGRNAILVAFASALQLDEDNHTFPAKTGDNRYRLSIRFRDVAQQFATTRELNLTNLNAKPSSGTPHEELVEKGKITVHDDGNNANESKLYIRIDHRLAMEETSESEKFIKFNEIVFLLQSGEADPILFSRIAVDDTFVLSNSNYSITYYIYF